MLQDGKTIKSSFMEKGLCSRSIAICAGQHRGARVSRFDFNELRGSAIKTVAFVYRSCCLAAQNDQQFTCSLHLSSGNANPTSSQIYHISFHVFARARSSPVLARTWPFFIMLPIIKFRCMWANL